MRRNRRRNRMMLLIILVVALSVGFAALATTLKIDGITTITKNTWSVYWDNIGNQSGVIPKTEPTISSEDENHLDNIVSFSVELDKPGDYYEFEVDAVNDGTIDAMLSVVSTNITNGGTIATLPDYIIYSVTYFDDSIPAEKHLLSRKIGNTPTKERYKIRIEFSRNVSNEELNGMPDEGLSYDIDVLIPYIQADNTAIPRPKDYLKVMSQTEGANVAAFDNTFGIKRSQVEQIYTMNTLELPDDLKDDIKKSWDVSAAQNGTVMAYALDTDSNSKYEIYLGQNGGVKANPSSRLLFVDYQNVTSIDVSNLITDDVTDMAGMFYNCKKLVNLVGEEKFNTSKVTNMMLMFGACLLLTDLDVSSFDTSNVVYFCGMFQECKKLVNLIGIENFNTDNAIDISYMFNYCSALTSIDVSNFNTSKVTTMEAMFNYCSALTSIDVSNFDMSKVTNTDAMFQSCSAAQNIILPDNYVTMGDFFISQDASYNGESFTIPKTVKSVGLTHLFYNFGKNGKFKKFIVEDGSTTLKTIDDVLYTYDGTRLIAIPRAKTFTDNTFIVPEGVTFMNELSFSRNTTITSIVLPNSYEIIRYIKANNNEYNFINSGNSLSIAIYRFTSISTYQVKEDNPRYMAYEGCLYSKDGTELIAVPFKYTGVLNVKDDTTTIGQEAFWDFENTRNASITTINIPGSVTTIESNQLTTLNKLADSGVVINIDSSNSVYEIVDTHIVAK